MQATHKTHMPSKRTVLEKATMKGTVMTLTSTRLITAKS